MFETPFPDHFFPVRLLHWISAPYGEKRWHVRLEFPGTIKTVIPHQTQCNLWEYVLSLDKNKIEKKA